MKLSITVVIASLFLLSSSYAQQGKLKAKSQMHKETAKVPDTLAVVALDAPPPPPPSLALSMAQLRFGAQAVGIESCVKCKIRNLSGGSQTLTSLTIGDQVNYSIPSPSQKMLPMSIPAKQDLEISICFKPLKLGEFPTRLVVHSAFDSLVLPIDGKSMKAEDISKLPKNELTVIKPKKKKHEWTLKLQLIASSKITMQLYDDLGGLVGTILNNDFKNEGTYEIPFDAIDKEKKPLPEGNYYLRCIIEDITKGSALTKFTKILEIED
jgi:hypothetical protein